MSETAVELKINQVVGLSFATGLLVGAVLGMAFMSMNIPEPVELEDGAPENGETQETDLETISGVEHDVEFGTADSNVEWDGEEVELEGRPYIGSEEAEKTIVSFEDFFCPFCVGFHNEEFAQSQGMNSAYSQIIENHVETGEARFYYMHLPVQGGDRPAEISECFNELGGPEAYYTFVSEHFEKFDGLAQLLETDQDRYEEVMLEWGEQLDIDREELDSCMSEGRQPEVVSQAEQGQSLGAEATPTIFIDGEMVEGAQPYSAFEAVLQAE